MVLSAIFIHALFALTALAGPTGSAKLRERDIATHAIQPLSLLGLANSHSVNAPPQFITENTAGLVLSSDPGTYQAVRAEFDVPDTHAPNGDTALYTVIPFIAIDQFICENFLAVGIQIHVENGITTYDPFYQWSPRGAFAIPNVTVHANQEVELSIRVTSVTTGVVTFRNRSNNQSAEVAVSGADFPLCLRTAVWGIYAVDQVPLPNFGIVAYDGVRATLTNGTTVGPTSPDANIVNIARNGTTYTEVDLGAESVGVRYTQ